MTEQCLNTHDNSARDNDQSSDTFFSQFWHLIGKTQFNLTYLLCIINRIVRVFIKGKIVSAQISTLIMSPAIMHYCKHYNSVSSITGAKRIIKYLVAMVTEYLINKITSHLGPNLNMLTNPTRE